MASHQVARVEREIPVLLAAEVHAVPPTRIPGLRFNDQVGIADPAIARVPGVVPVITLIRGHYPAHPAGAGGHVASGYCLLEDLRCSTAKCLRTVEKVALGRRERLGRRREDELVGRRLDLSPRAQPLR